jgi:2,5-diketo-D-gluconate reductase A
LAEATIRPTVNQIQLNPRITRPDQHEYDRAHDIVTVAWSPLGQGKGLLNESTLQTMAATHGKTPAQIALRWFIELGIVAIPRSSNPERLRQNIDLFDFTLTAAEVDAISALDTGAEKRVDSDTGGQ